MKASKVRSHKEFTYINFNHLWIRMWNGKTHTHNFRDLFSLKNAWPNLTYLQNAIRFARNNCVTLNKLRLIWRIIDRKVHEFEMNHKFSNSVSTWIAYEYFQSWKFSKNCPLAWFELGKIVTVRYLVPFLVH